MNLRLFIFLFLTTLLVSCNPVETKLGDNFFPTVEESLVTSTLQLQSGTLIVGDSTRVTLLLRDSQSRAFVSSGALVSFSVRGGTSGVSVGAVRNEGEGRYSAVLTAQSAGSAVFVHAQVDGKEVESAAPSLTVVSGLSAFIENWNFNTSTDYDFDNSVVSFDGTGVSLLRSDLLDDDNSSSGFAGGSSSGVLFGTLADGMSSGMKLSGSIACNANRSCSELDSSWTPRWASLVSYWRLNETSGTSVADSKGTNTGSTTSVTLGTDGKFGKSASFNGTSSNVSFGTIFPNGAYTKSAWVKYVPGPRNYPNIISSSSSGGNHALFISLGYLAAYQAASTRIIDSIAFPISQWTHIAVTFDPSVSSGAMKLFKNGVQVGTTATNVPTQTNLSLFLGVFSGNSDTFFNGELDEVGVWSVALTDAEIKTIFERQSVAMSGSSAGVFTSRIIEAKSSTSWTSFSWSPTLPFMKALPDYSAGAIQNESSGDYISLVGSSGTTGSDDLMDGIVGLWHLNESSGTSGASSVIDFSGQGHHGTPQNSPSFGSTGIFGNGIGFSGNNSGSNQFINMGSPPGLDIDGAVSISAWVNLNSEPSNLGSILRTGIFGDEKYMLGINSSRYPIFEQCDGSNFYQFTANSPINLNQFTHLSAVRAADGKTVTIYINGVASGTTTLTNGVPSGGSPIVRIGATFESNQQFNGVIDEVAIWSRSLHANEVKQLYQRGASRIKFQVRSCSDASCTSGSPAWKGPDGTSNTFFSELYNMSTQAATPSGVVRAGLPSMLLQNYTSPVASNRYFQYRAILESDSSTTALMPELKSVRLGPDSFSDSSPAVVSKTGYDYVTLSNLVETLGSDGCAGGVVYNLGVGSVSSSATWYYWSGSNWSSSTSGTASTANTASVVASNLGSFAVVAGTGKVFVKGFLRSSGSAPCALDNLRLNGVK